MEPSKEISLHLVPFNFASRQGDEYMFDWNNNGKQLRRWIGFVVSSGCRAFDIWDFNDSRIRRISCVCRRKRGAENFRSGTPYCRYYCVCQVRNGVKVF